MAAEDLAPPGVLQNSQFFLPITNGLMDRSARVLDSSIRASFKGETNHTDLSRFSYELSPLTAGESSFK